MQEPIIRRELLAAVTGKSSGSLNRDISIGKLPPMDAAIGRKIQGWRLSTITAWNPRLGYRLEGLLRSPYLPAA